MARISHDTVQEIAFTQTTASIIPTNLSRSQYQKLQILKSKRRAAETLPFSAFYSDGEP